MESHQSLTVLTSNKVDITTTEALVAHRMDDSIAHYRNVPLQLRMAWLSNAIIRLNALKHQKIEVQNMTPEEVVTMDVEALDSYIMDNIYYSDLTFYEIQEAFRMGIVGKYGEYYGINAISLYGFIEGYWKSTRKQEAVKKVRAIRLKERQAKEERRQADLARMEGWGMDVKTVTPKEVEAKERMIVKPARGWGMSDEEHREMVRRQAREILGK